VSDQDEDIVCVEADGLALEIGISPDATALDATLPKVIAAAIAAANRAAGPEQGEVTVVVAGAPFRPAVMSELVTEVQELVDGGLRLKEATAAVATTHGASRRELYEASLRVDRK